MFDDAEEELVERPPVVTIMGHVDHGKTSLLDAIRSDPGRGRRGRRASPSTSAPTRSSSDGRQITFLDTPGHEAFTAMRARGAKVTDIAVIVVAADDGVKPQTQEAVDHAKEAGVPMLVAVNKIDKEGAQPDRVRAEMTQLGLQPVEWGGETEFVNVSAKTREGLDDLLDTILVMAEVEELRSNPEAAGVRDSDRVEARPRPRTGRDPPDQRGTLEVGDSLVAGAHWGRVRAMNDFMGNRDRPGAARASRSRCSGFDGVPEAGEHVRAVENERRARQLATRARDAPEGRGARPSQRQEGLARGHLQVGRPGAQPGHQGRRRRIARGDRGRDRQAAAGRGLGQRDPRRRRRRDASPT